MSLTSVANLLFFVMDPIGNIPLFLAPLKPVAPAWRTAMVICELLIAYALLAGFLLAGRPLLGALAVQVFLDGVARKQLQTPNATRGVRPDVVARGFFTVS